MPFGNKARYVRAYEFGCLPPTEGEKEAIEIMWQRVKLWNTLVELEHKYDEQKEALVAPFITAADDKDHYAEYNAQRKEAFKREDTKIKLAEFQKSENTEFKAIYNNSGLYWGNYLSVTTAWQVARKRPGDLRFHSARDSGKVSVQWPTGMPVADAFDHTSNVLRPESNPSGSL